MKKQSHTQLDQDSPNTNQLNTNPVLSGEDVRNLVCNKKISPDGNFSINGFHPVDFVAKVKQINSQSDLISMSNSAGPSYLAIKSSVYIILV